MYRISVERFNSFGSKSYYGPCMIRKQNYIILYDGEVGVHGETLYIYEVGHKSICFISASICAGTYVMIHILLFSVDGHPLNLPPYVFHEHTVSSVYTLCSNRWNICTK